MIADERRWDVLLPLALFAGSDPEAVRALERRLRARVVADGDVLMHRGEPGNWFAIVIEGELVVTLDETRIGPDDPVLGLAGRGAILGELALLEGGRRSATALARGPATVLVGDEEAFACLLDLPGVRPRIARVVAQKLAAQATPSRFSLRDGTELELRPLLPADRAALVAGLDRTPTETIRHRFFSSGPLSSSIIDYLVDIDYVRHFAWGARPPGGGIHDGAGVVRYVRGRDDPAIAEMAVTVDHAYQGRGLGTVLVGALAAAAQAAGVERFEALVLEDNTAMRRVLDKAGARWRREESGVVATTVEVDRVVGFIAPELASTLRSTASATMSAALVALGRARELGGGEPDTTS
jgi:protein lysine acetyltransferase